MSPPGLNKILTFVLIGKCREKLSIRIVYWNKTMKVITTPMIGSASTKPIPMNMIDINCVRASG